MVTEYPISKEARERILSARASDVAFNTRRILAAGGYPDPVIEAAVEAAVAAVMRSEQLTLERLRTRIEEKGVPRDRADQIARELAPAT